MGELLFCFLFVCEDSGRIRVRCAIEQGSGKEGQTWFEPESSGGQASTDRTPPTDAVVRVYTARRPRFDS